MNTKYLPTTTEEQAELAKYESQISEGIEVFLRVGHALKIISSKRLYRDKYNTFAAYCEQRWEMARRTAYLKIKLVDIYESVHTCAHIAPTNENQLRQLSKLPTDEMRQSVWQQTVTLHDESNRAMTAAMVKEVATSVLQEQAGSSLTTYLMQDRTFPGIKYRWEACIGGVDIKTGRQTWTLASLPTMSMIETGIPASDNTEERPLVLVSPDIDIFEELSKESIQRIIEVIKVNKQYQYLLWATDPKEFKVISDKPSNVELCARIESQDDINDLEQLPQQLHKISALWFIPGPRFALRLSQPFLRVLVGTPGNSMTQLDTDETANCRHLLANLMREACSLHITAGINNLLSRQSRCQPLQFSGKDGSR